MLRRAAVAVAALLLVAAAHAPSKPAAPPPRKFTDLKSGVYAAELKGMLCTACAGMVSEEVRRVEGVEKAEVDFDERVLRVVIAPRKTVRVDNLKRALGRASRRIDLGTSFSLGEIRYIP